MGSQTQQMGGVSAFNNSLFYSLFFISSLIFLLASHFLASEAQANPPQVVKGLSFSFYSKTCPKLETIVRNHLKEVFKKDNGQAPGLLVIMFHDCFVSGCDGSLLLDAKAGEGERDQRTNRGIRKEALKTIDDLRALVHNKCGRIVSCADITVLAARDAIFLSGGPDFAVPLGRRDGLIINTKDTEKIPLPFSNTSEIINTFKEKKVFDVIDVVAFVGAHTFGRAHCGTFYNRLSPLDPNMDETLVNILKATCPFPNCRNETYMDIRTPTLFDNKYYVDLLNRQGVFTSEQDLINDPRTKELVKSFANDQNLFFEKFTNAVLKMSQLDVLTENQGEIRAKCNVINKKQSMLTSTIEEVVELSDMF